MLWRGNTRKQLLTLANTAIVYPGSKASNMMMPFPCIIATPILFYCPLIAISTQIHLSQDS